MTLYHGDCLDIIPAFADDEFDAVFADPPYGIGKAEWDERFVTEWMGLAARVAPTMAVTPGVWNLAAMPEQVETLSYRWTLAAHLRNGMTRGALGYGNWIPCVVYTRDESVKWTSRFADWCAANGISKRDLDAAVGTSDMGGWWTSKLARRAQIPSQDKWAKIRERFNPPSDFDTYVKAADPCQQGVDSASFNVGSEPMADHPSPKPLDVTRWMLSRLPGYRLASRGVLDPFAGSGTTLRAAKDDGRRAVGIEREERYCEGIVRRLSQDTLDLWGAA